MYDLRRESGGGRAGGGMGESWSCDIARESVYCYEDEALTILLI